MNKVIIFALILASTSVMGCMPSDTSEGQVVSSNEQYDIKKLFTSEGCTTYRFYDLGHHHYFIRCSATRTVSTLNTQLRGSGKHPVSEVVETEMETE